MENYLFPEEIITDILSRLPADSVLECRRVCKTWRTLTYLPSFARLHLLQHSPKKLRDVIDDEDEDHKYQNHSSISAAASKVGFVSLIDLEENKRGRQLYCGEFDDDGKKVSYNTLRKIKHLTFEPYTFQLLSSCNGLICLLVLNDYGVRDPVYICNPITREYINLPKLTYTPSEKPSFYTGYIFGYIPKTNEYKVVRIYYNIIHRYQKNINHTNSVGRIEVYTLGSGSGWRNKGETTYICSDGGVLANGALHWSSLMDKKHIVSFDLADEEFHLLPAPPYQLDHEQYKLLELGGLLCAHPYVGEFVRIWSLKKINNKKSSDSDNMMKEQEIQSWGWSIQFCIDMGSIDLMYEYYLFSLTGKCELLLWRIQRFLYRYDLKTKSLEQVVDYVRVSKFVYAIPHINSLISLRALGEDAKLIQSPEDDRKGRD